MFIIRWDSKNYGVVRREILFIKSFGVFNITDVYINAG
jgi:lipoprotein signal peptidase